MSIFAITRQELYNLVWQEQVPDIVQQIERIAKELNEGWEQSRRMEAAKAVLQPGSRRYTGEQAGRT